MAKLIDSAMEYARRIHKNDTFSGSGYDKHLSDVYRVAKRFDYQDPAILACCWLHDVVDKPELNLSTLKFMFGAEVENTLLALKINNQLPLKEARRDRLTRINNHPQALIVYLCEFISEIEIAKKEDRQKYYSMQKEISVLEKNLSNAPEKLLNSLLKHK